MARYSRTVTSLGLNPLLDLKDRRPRYVNVKYPNIPKSINDIYIIITEGDRYDILAQSYYNDSSLWWIISSANYNTRQDSLFPSPGSQVRIPSSSRLNQILANYESLNS
tara:strand:+ start:133 stop:459 length:327 start_codon:yes stop_codon:yes gene_type:complete